MINLIFFAALFASVSCTRVDDDKKAMCPDASIPDESGQYCCPAYCGQCGGDDCHLFPGGEFNCCYSTFKYSCHDGVSPCILSDEPIVEDNDPTKCPDDAVMDESGQYCCPKYCGQCGGKGCHLLPGGEYECCWSTFLYSCFDGVAPCKIMLPEELDTTDDEADTSDDEADTSDDEADSSDDEDSVCPDASIIDDLGKNCCPKYCGQCGGNGCHLFPGGEFNCCPSTFKYTCHDGVAPCHLEEEKPDDIVHDPTVCPENSIMDSLGKNCCPAYCTHCGDFGCHLLPGGEYNCCPSTFLYSCYDGVAPCHIQLPPEETEKPTHKPTHL